MIKGTDKQLNEELHKVRSGRVPSAGASVPGIGVCHPLGMCMCSANTEAL